MIQASRKVIYLTLGWMALSAGVLGIFLPLIPTTPFALLAAYCFSKSSQRMHNWLLNTKHLGPVIKEWEAHGVVRPSAKLLSTFAIVLLFSFSLYVTEVHYGIKYLLVAIALGILTFIWSRPGHPPDQHYSS